VTEQLARSHGDVVVAIHLTDVPFGHLFQKPDDPSPGKRNSSNTMRRGCRKKALMR
jgi:hypothetical protein